VPLHNADIAAVFEEIADLLELGDENPFRVRAYRNAARVVSGLSLDLAARLAEGGELPKLPGIGADLNLQPQGAYAARTRVLNQQGWWFRAEDQGRPDPRQRPHRPGG